MSTSYNVVVTGAGQIGLTLAIDLGGAASGASAGQKRDLTAQIEHELYSAVTR